ncbi:MAG: HD-GYP domain-containing protein, partial [Solirubrobacteraceae bacterium]
NVEFGALLHDIGKITVPKEIINKPSELDEREWAIIKTHTIEGQRMLETIGGFMSEIGRIVRASHEHWDGSGYPDGLREDAIPLEARIVSTCDAFNAMTTTRSYRKAMAPADARAELLRCAGTQFDPDVVRALLAVSETSAPVGQPAASPAPRPEAPKGARALGGSLATPATRVVTQAPRRTRRATRRASSRAGG